MFCTFCHKSEKLTTPPPPPPPVFGKGNFGGKLSRVACLHIQRNGRHFWRVKYSLKLGKASLHRYYLCQNFCKNRSIYHRLYKHFCVLQFLRKIRKFKMAAILWQVKYPLKLTKASLHRYPVDQTFAEIALPCTVFENQAFFWFVIFAKNLKIQNGCHFWREKIFFEN